jgi:outer membrane protein TolC
MQPIKNIHLKIALCILACCFFAKNKATAQETLPINFEIVLQLCNANNLTIQEYQIRQKAAAADLAKAKEWWLPELYAGIQTEQRWGAAMNADGRFALDVVFDNLWAGIGLDATWNFADGIFKTKAAKLQNKAAEYQTQAAKNQTILTAIEAYYDFLGAQLAYQAYEKLAEESDVLSQQISIQVEAGLGYESDNLLSKSNLNHLKIEMLDAKRRWGATAARLANLLNMKPNIQLVSVDTLLNPVEQSTENEEVAITAAYDRRPELKMLNLNQEALATAKKTATIGLALPELRLNYFTSQFGDLNNRITPLNAIQFPETDQLYPTQAFNIGLLWKIPLGTLLYQGDIKKYDAQLDLKANEIAQQKLTINEEIAVCKITMDNAREQINLAKEGSGYAKKALNQSIARQELGVIRPFEILQAQEVFIKMRLDYIKVVSRFNVATYRYQVAIGNNL